MHGPPVSEEIVDRDGKGLFNQKDSLNYISLPVLLIPGATTFRGENMSEPQFAETLSVGAFSTSQGLQDQIEKVSTNTRAFRGQPFLLIIPQMFVKNGTGNQPLNLRKYL